MSGAHRRSTTTPRAARRALRRPLHVAAVTIGAAGIASWSAGPGMLAVADSGDVDVVNTETVQIYSSADGTIDTKRIYEQLELSGTGTVSVANPVETDGLRNLEGFGGVKVEDGEQLVNATVDGTQQLRSVSTFDGEVPLTVEASYELDGEQVEPADVVGRSGHLAVTYTVKNVSAVPTEVQFDNGTGKQVTRTVEVPLPLVGSLVTVAPPGFDHVTSGQANMAGDGKGGIKMSFTTTLIPPIGPDTAVFGYEADITDGVVPRAEMTALPVNPLQSPSFSGAAKSYQGGAETGVALTEGATTIDDNLLKLRDGAGTLLAGLIKLRAGSQELSDGLVERAAPGAQELATGLNDVAAPGAAALAAGTGQLASGLGDLDAGAGRLARGSSALDDGVDLVADGTGRLRSGSRDLADGAGRVAGGAGDLSDGADRLQTGTGAALVGSRTLTTGLGQLSAGLQQLQAQDGLPAAAAGVKALQAGIAQLTAGLGDASNPQSIVGGLTRLAAPEGLPAAADGARAIADGLGQLRGDDAGTGGLTRARGGVAQVAEGLRPLANGGADQLLGAVDAAAASPGCQGDPVCRGNLAAARPGLADLKAKAPGAVGALDAVATGLGTAIGSIDAQLRPGTLLLAGQLDQAAGGAEELRAGAVQASAGATQISNGLDQLANGLGAATEGVLELSAGADSAYAGSQDLTAGVGQLDAGAGQLADGSSALEDGSQRVAGGADELADGAATLDSGVEDLSDGAGALSAGAGLLAEGATTASDGASTINEGAGRLADGLGDAAAGSQELADGIVDAADGSTRLADGVGQAADGAPALVSGAQRLSDEGTKVLVGKGKQTARSYGEMYATLAAGADRADTQDMALGAPAGASGLTAYSFVLQGEDGAGGRNIGRGLLAGGALVLGAGGLLVRRRLLA